LLNHHLKKRRSSRGALRRMFDTLSFERLRSGLADFYRKAICERHWQNLKLPCTSWGKTPKRAAVSG
jgi:hypothetical protein